MNIMDNVLTYFLTEEEIKKITKMDQRTRHLELYLSDIEAKEMWRLLREESEYVEEILDGYEKLVRDRRIQSAIDRLPKKEGYMMQRAIYTIPEWTDEILEYWESRANDYDDSWGDDDWYGDDN